MADGFRVGGVGGVPAPSCRCSSSSCARMHAGAAPRHQGLADARVNLVGRVAVVGAEEEASAREIYMAKFPESYWASFGDFRRVARGPACWQSCPCAHACVHTVVASPRTHPARLLPCLPACPSQLVQDGGGCGCAHRGRLCARGQGGSSATRAAQRVQGTRSTPSIHARAPARQPRPQNANARPTPTPRRPTGLSRRVLGRAARFCGALLCASGGAHERGPRRFHGGHGQALCGHHG